jgi:type IV pilus assembly protein PilO
METGMEGKPWYFGVAVGVVLGILVAGLGWYQLVQPKRDAIESQERSLQDLQKKINEGRAAQQNLPRFREEVRLLQEELDKLLRILPARRNVHEIMRRVRLLVERGDLSLKRFRPGNEREKDFYSEWPMDISLEGGYHNLALFFDRIGRFSRIINVDNLNVNALSSQTNHTLAASFTAKTFIYKESEGGSASEQSDDF